MCFREQNFTFAEYIEIDDDLMQRAIGSTGPRTKKVVVGVIRGREVYVIITVTDGW